MKILIAPLNWGLGHAARCVPLIRNYLSKGNEVVLGGDGDSLLLLRRTFPDLRVVDLPSLELRYDEDPQQRGFYWRAIPLLIRFTLADRYYLRQVLAREKFDMVISDNRFGLFSRDVHSVYITHQLYPILPKRLRVFQPFARALHAYIYRRYDEVWVPDYEDIRACLSGELSHGGKYDKKAKYIGPLSRFQDVEEIDENKTYQVVAIVSGLEPQRTIFEREIIQRFENQEDQILLVRGKMGTPQTVIQKNAMTIVPSITDKDMVAVVRGAEKIIARSGYSTIMDLHALGALEKAELHPTPGQSEQEYLSSLM